jgi:hypothetical protein
MPVSFLHLPGELRQKIYLECIFNARLCRCSECHDLELDLSHIPRLIGVSSLLPLLLTSKQIHHELTYLLYSNIKPLVIHGHYLTTGKSGDIYFQHSSPLSRPWPKHTYIQDFVRNVDVIVGLDMSVVTSVARSAFEFRLPKPINNLAIYSSANVSDLENASQLVLVEYLKSFKSLSSIQIIIEILKKHRDTPPRMDHLAHFLPLFELPGVQIILRFELGQRFNDVPSRKTLLAWRSVWNQCLAPCPHLV